MADYEYENKINVKSKKKKSALIYIF